MGRNTWRAPLALGLTVAVTGASCGGHPAATGAARTVPVAGRQAAFVPEVNHSDRLGRLPADQSMSVTVRVRSLSAIPAIRSVAEARGLTVLSADRQFDTVTLRGSAHAIEGALGVTLYEWRDRTSGHRFYANDAGPRLSAPMVSLVSGVVGLDDASLGIPLAAGENAGSSGGLSAAQLQAAYNVLPLLKAGINGRGQTVAIYAVGGFSNGDIDEFDMRSGLPTAVLTTSIPGGSGPGGWETGSYPPSRNEFESEAEADIEAVHAMAPQASIHIYEAAVPSDAEAVGTVVVGFEQTLLNFIEGVAADGDSVATISYGNCEDQLNPSVLEELAYDFSALAADDHVSVFAGSGDAGKYCSTTTGPGPTDFDTSTVGANYPSSDPSVTSVGATFLQLNSGDSTINSEQAWDVSSTAATGGGKSEFSAPSWQLAALKRARYDPSHRWTPDVAMDGDPGSGLLGYAWHEGGYDSWGPLGGTSLSSPLWAGIAADYDQRAAAVGAAPLGAANQVLYRLNPSKRDLFDVTSNENDGSDLAGPAVKGWDPATGLGTPNAASLVYDGIAMGGSAPGPGPGPSPGFGPSTTIVYQNTPYLMQAGAFHLVSQIPPGNGEYPDGISAGVGQRYLTVAARIHNPTDSSESVSAFDGGAGNGVDIDLLAPLDDPDGSLGCTGAAVVTLPPAALSGCVNYFSVESDSASNGEIPAGGNVEISFVYGPVDSGIDLSNLRIIFYDPVSGIPELIAQP